MAQKQAQGISRKAIVAVAVVVLILVALAFAIAISFPKARVVDETVGIVRFEQSRHDAIEQYERQRAEKLEAQKRQEAKEAEEQRAREREEAAKLENLKNELPYIGLDESQIDATWLGKHDMFDSEPVSGGDKQGAVTYMWTARNGTDDVIFYAWVRDKKIIAVKHGLEGTDYWPEIRGMPNLYATGQAKYRAPVPDEDPGDYDDPGEYADNAEDWFAEQGYEDPYNAAYEYWENNAG